MWLVVLVYFHTNMPAVPEPFRMVEFFSGIGNVGKSCRYGYYATAQVDIAMGDAGATRPSKENAFDLTKPSGLACLVQKKAEQKRKKNKLGWLCGFSCSQSLGTSLPCWPVFAQVSVL